MSESAKVAVSHLSAVALVYPQSNPAWLFLDHKDKGYPNFPNRLCPIGGNWVGEAAKQDKNPWATLAREIMEELVILEGVEQTVSAEEARKDLGYQEAEDYVLKRKPLTGEELVKSQQELEKIKRRLVDALTPFGDYYQIVPGAVLKRLTGKDKPDVRAICSYWTCPLSDELWQRLLLLKQKAGRLSNESFDRVVSVRQIVSQKLEFVWGHDQVVQRHFINEGFPEAFEMPMVDGIVMQEIGEPMSYYKRYLEKYEFQKSPFAVK